MAAPSEPASEVSLNQSRSVLRVKEREQLV